MFALREQQIVFCRGIHDPGGAGREFKMWGLRGIEQEKIHHCIKGETQEFNAKCSEIAGVIMRSTGRREPPPPPFMVGLNGALIKSAGSDDP